MSPAMMQVRGLRRARTDAALLQKCSTAMLCVECVARVIWASLIGGLPLLYSPPFRGITCHNSYGFSSH